MSQFKPRATQVLTRIDGGTLAAASGQKSSNSRNSCSTSLAREVGRVGVTVNAIAPGFIDTEMTGGLAGSDRDRVAGRSALRRLAAPEDIAAMAALLVGESGRNITGAVMTVDAGGTA
jgi:NAD(P)-dependent dehydrogenase (short-subunit alcohol dehydrogenase family)